MMLGTRGAETILASGLVRPHTKAGHMIASDPINLYSTILREGCRPHMRSGQRGVSICFMTLPRLGRQVRDSQRDRLAHRPQGAIPLIALSREGFNAAR
ncbi:hypothetical protein MPL3356_490047 [Mesorhizobium plurifarium]|uniref:Uncharacterized protein n=1 Tax=Mesorhizobium plurifarium TaxID=69974 RepID=A0A090E5U1_MESPL|nr:hypothetical protein MPL3356_490047 [Mesorhizobium plurifarium]